MKISDFYSSLISLATPYSTKHATLCQSPNTSIELLQVVNQCYMISISHKTHSKTKRSIIHYERLYYFNHQYIEQAIGSYMENNCLHHILIAIHYLKYINGSFIIQKHEITRNFQENKKIYFLFKLGNHAVHSICFVPAFQSMYQKYIILMSICLDH